MDKRGISIMKWFSFSYWQRRNYIKNKWESRKTSIKHLFFKGRMIHHTTDATNTPLNQRSNLIYNAILENNTHGCYDHSNDVMQERISNSLEYVN